MTRTPKSTLIKRSELIMPDSVNMLYNLMGGNLLHWMDATAAIAAQRLAGVDCVTAHLSHVTFNKAIKNGDIITIEAKVIRAFNTSMEIYVRVLTGSPPNIYDTVSHEAFFIFVAVDKNLKPTKIPQIKPETEEEKKMYEEALVRKDMRLLLNEKNMDPKHLLAYIETKKKS